MLAELAAANTAFSIIKSAVQNSGDLLKAGKAISDFVDAKDTLHKKANKKKYSFFSDPNKTSDMEEFLALEQIKEKEEELKQFMIYAGRPGLWSDWIKFQAKARKERQEKEKQRKENRKQLFEIILVAFGLIFALGLLSMIVYAGLKANNIL